MAFLIVLSLLIFIAFKGVFLILFFVLDKDVVKGNRKFNRHEIHKFDDIDEDYDCEKEVEDIRMKSE